MQNTSQLLYCDHFTSELAVPIFDLLYHAFAYQLIVVVYIMIIFHQIFASVTNIFYIWKQSTAIFATNRKILWGSPLICMQERWSPDCRGRQYNTEFLNSCNLTILFCPFCLILGYFETFIHISIFSLSQKTNGL